MMESFFLCLSRGNLCERADAEKRKIHIVCSTLPEYVTLHLNKKNFFYYRFDLTKKTPPTKILWVQPVTLHLNKKNFFYYRFDLTKKTPPPAKILWVQPVTLHLNKKIFFITDLTWPKRSPPPAKIFWVQTVTLHQTLTPDTTTTTCYPSAAQCWKAFLVSTKFCL